MTEAKVLMVDDEENLLQAFKRALRKNFFIEAVKDGEIALGLLQDQGPFAVVVSDLRMPKMNGIEFLARVRRLSPNTIRILLTGYADLPTAIQAINEGNIFRFMTKPCDIDALARNVQMGVEQYNLVTAEKELLNNTLGGCIKVLLDILALLNPDAVGRASRIQKIVSDIAGHMGLTDRWHVDTAAMLSQIGCVVLPQDILQRVLEGGPVSARERSLFERHPQVAADLLRKIPRMEQVASIIALQFKHFDGKGFPEGPVSGEEIPLGARILKVALDLDACLRVGANEEEALLRLKARDGVYDPEVLSALEAFLHHEPPKPKWIPLSLLVVELEEGMILTKDLKTRDGKLLLVQGYEMSPAMIERLKGLAESGRVKEPVEIKTCRGKAYSRALVGETEAPV